MLGIIAVCVILGICSFMICRACLVESRAHPLPPAYPGLLPIIGHAHLLLTDTEKVWQFVKKLFEHSVQHGVTYIQVGPEVFYCVADPEDALVVANTCLGKSFIYDFAKYWLGEGLITGKGIPPDPAKYLKWSMRKKSMGTSTFYTEIGARSGAPLTFLGLFKGDHWHRHRQLLKPAFTLPIINGYLEVFNSQSRSMLSALERSAGKGKIDPLPHLQQLTLASSFLTTFGKTTNDEKLYPRYVKATNGMLYLFMRRFQKFWLHNDFIHTLLGYKKHESELVKIVDEISDELIQTTKLAIDTRSLSSYVSYEPLLDQMLQLPEKNHLTDQEIREELHTTIVAAYDTTAMSLQSALVLIGSYPKVQEKMYEEIMRVVGSDRDIDRDDIRKLVYIEAVIKESLRLVPTVPVTLRYLDRDVKLKNYTLRAGSQCMISNYGIYRHPSWGPDADQFRPERWLDPSTLPPNHVITDAGFSFGKRSCIGKTYAMTSMKVTLAHILRNFVIIADYTKMQLQIYLTLKPVSGNEISLQRRRSSMQNEN